MISNGDIVVGPYTHRNQGDFDTIVAQLDAATGLLLVTLSTSQAPLFGRVARVLLDLISSAHWHYFLSASVVTGLLLFFLTVAECILEGLKEVQCSFSQPNLDLMEFNPRQSCSRQIPFAVKQSRPSALSRRRCMVNKLEFCVTSTIWHNGHCCNGLQ